MTRPYSLFKKSNGYYYVQFLLADGSRSQNKSTGTKDHKEAKSQSVDRISFFNSMSTYDFSPEEIDKKISIMQKRGFILSAVKPNSKQSIPIEDFLDEFWNYEKSPHVQELALEGKILSRSHVKNERSRVENYWIPKLKGKCIGSITNDMLTDIVSDKKIQKLANKLAMQIGMRASEIRGLRICDIHAEGIIVNHARDRYARANKCCKNGESRQIPYSNFKRT